MASLFTGQTPAITDASDGTPGIATATTVRLSVSGYITHIEFRATDTVSGSYTPELWRVDADDPGGTGTLVASGSSVGSGSITAGQYNQLPLTAPYAITANTVLYRCAVHSSAGRYVATLTFFTSHLVNGDITADANGDDPVGLGGLAQGTFVINAAAEHYPDQPGNGTCYFVGPIFQAGGVQVNGTLSASLGGITSAITGTRTVPASASTSLGALSASITGTRKVLGAAAADLGGLTAQLLAGESVGPDVPIVSRTPSAAVYVSQTIGGTS